MRPKIEPISEQLRDAIDASKLSRYRICKTVGLAESSMSKYMAGERGISLTMIDKIGLLLGLRIVADEAGKPKRKVTR